MADQLSPHEPNSPDAEPAGTRRLRKRSYIACRRCHSLKVKCSGGVPCQRCQKARKTALCQYPPRTRRVTVSASYLHRLQNQNRDVEDSQVIPDDSSIHVGGDEPTMSMAPESPSPSEAIAANPPVDADLGAVERDLSRIDPQINNPIHNPERLFALDQASPSSQQFVGESTCLAFGDRILQCLTPHSTTTPLSSSHQYVRNPVFARQLNDVDSSKFPERIRANLLVRVALRFIGQDYHLFLHHDFLDKFDKAYGSRQPPESDSAWICKFFVVLALGEMYSTSLPAAREPRPSSVPGTGYFLTAVGLLQDLFEEPSIAQIETLLLFCFYSNALGRVKSAHMYSGMAVRSSTCLGLHRRIPDTTIMSPTEREHRTRLWWTVYIFDRSTCSKLGQPLTIQDADIDVGMPSTLDNQTRLGSPDHLIAYIKLAQITGYIMRDIYAPASKASGGRLVQNVRAILQKLRKWDAHVPTRLRWKPEGGVPRSVASLQLHFNQCIILTTRPILLHIFKIRNPFTTNQSATDSATNDPPQVSDTIRSLADSCVAAARTSNTILSQLFIENALATCGYFDAHHLFASTLVLIISAISSPNSSDSDAVQTAFQLLMVMRDNGNAAAGEYFTCLAKIQWTVSRLFQGTAAEQTTTAIDAPSNAAGNITIAPNPPSGLAEMDYDWSQLAIPPSFYATYDDAGAVGDMTADPLDNPLLQAFLGNGDGGRDDNTFFDTEDMDFMT